MLAKITLLTVLFVFVTGAFQLSKAQAGRKTRRQHKEMVKNNKRQKKESEKAYEKALKEHYKNQGKKTARRMKKNQKRTIKMKKNKRPPFWKKWFSYRFEFYKNPLVFTPSVC